MDTIIQKISKRSKFISNFLFFGCIIIIICILILLIGISIVSFTNNTLSFNIQSSFIDNSTNYIPTVNETNLLILFEIIKLIIIFILINLLRCIFLDISKNYTPFDQKQVKRIKSVAKVALIMTVLSSTFDMISNIILHEKGIFNFDFLGILVSLVIYCMAYIFEYGHLLQKQSDETL